MEFRSGQQDPLKLEFQATLMWVVGMEPLSSIEAVHVPNLRAISPTPRIMQYFDPLWPPMY